MVAKAVQKLHKGHGGAVPVHGGVTQKGHHNRVFGAVVVADTDRRLAVVQCQGLTTAVIAAVKLISYSFVGDHNGIIHAAHKLEGLAFDHSLVGNGVHYTVLGGGYGVAEAALGKAAPAQHILEQIPVAQLLQYFRGAVG